MRPGQAWTASGLVVAVIGGANGIGRAVAGQLIDQGASVAVGDRDGAAARASAQELSRGAPSVPGAELSGGAPGPARTLGTDVEVTDSASVTRFLDEAEASFGPIDVVINSAGVMWVGPFLEEPETAVDRQIEINLLGAMRVVRLATPRMLGRGGGHIVTIASMGSVLGLPGEASYAASKHGVLGYLKSVESELRGSGVQISAVLPSVVDTELARGTAAAGVPMLQPSDVAAAVLRTLEHPRLERAVPSYAGMLARLTDVLPPSLRRRVHRVMVPNNLTGSQRSLRAEYEARHLRG